MRIADYKVPQLRLLQNEKPVSFLCKTMLQIEDEKNHRLRQPHRHSYYCIIFIEDAKGVHHIDFKTYSLKKKTVIFISPEQIHYLIISGKPQGYVFLFTLDFIERNGIPLTFLSGLELFFACDEVMPVTLPNTLFPDAKNYAEIIFKEYNGESYMKEESIASWLKLFLITCRRARQAAYLQNPALISSSSTIIKHFKELLEKHYREFHRVSEYASLLHLTSNYLNEVVSAQTGQSAKDLIQSRIILEAKRLATYSDLSMKEIAFDLGYGDASHFSKFFKNNTAVDFSGFKDQIRKKYM